MSNFKPIDGSKEDFRKYLDRKGVLDAITKVLIKCNSDRPENAIEYLLENMGERLKDKDTIMRLEKELGDAKNEIDALKLEINALKINATCNLDKTSTERNTELGYQQEANTVENDAVYSSIKLNSETEPTEQIDPITTHDDTNSSQNVEEPPQ